MLTVPATTMLSFFLGAVLLGACLTLAGVALGGLFVFRTKREPHESLFHTGLEKGEAFVQDDLDDGLASLERVAGRNRQPPIMTDDSGLKERFDEMEESFKVGPIGKAHQKFKNQLEGQLSRPTTQVN
jgi:hypothetical protein